MQVVIIACCSTNGVIGCDGKIPWDIKKDRRAFRRKTMGFPVIVGRKTFESMPVLDGRDVFVMSKSEKEKYASPWTSPVELLNFIKCAYDPIRVYVIGGEQIYRLFLDYADCIDLTIVRREYEGDAYFPDIEPEKWRQIASYCDGELNYRHYERKPRGWQIVDDFR